MLKYDSPVMDFLGKVTDFIMLNILWVICSIPIVTIGAATAAKYTIAMRIIRHEDSPVIMPFFKAFKDNFKQATIIWMILMIALLAVGLDWLWIYNRGFANVASYYKLILGILSMFVIGMCMCVFPFIARFTVTLKDALKGAAILTFLHYIQFFLIALLEVGTVVASLWYAGWLIAIAIFGTTTAFYFNCILLVKEFKKTEEKLGEESKEASDEG